MKKKESDRSAETKRYIGRPLTIGRLLASLEDGQLYSCSRIASMAVDRDANRAEHHRLRKTLYQYTRRHQFPKGGEDILSWEGRQVPAWTGRTWKELLTRQDLAPRAKTASAFNRKKTADRGPGRQMKYGHFIKKLDPFALYTAESVVGHGESRGLLKEGRNRANEAFRAKKALKDFQKENLPDEADGFIPKRITRHLPAWQGWRWMLALPEYVMSEADKKALKRRVTEARGTSGKTVKIHGSAGTAAVGTEADGTGVAPPVEASVFKSGAGRRRIFGVRAGLGFAAAAMVALAFFVGWLRIANNDFDEIQRLSERPTRQGIEKMHRMFLKEGTNPIMRGVIELGMVDAVSAMPTEENIETLRSLLREGARSTWKISKTIADIHRDLGHGPLFVANGAKPVLSSSIPGYEVVLFEEGYVQLGDWVNIENRTGYISNIHKRGLVFESNKGPVSIHFKVPRTLTQPLIKLSSITCWEGGMNMRQIVRTLCEINRWDVVDFGGGGGHIGGTFSCGSFEEFLEIVQEDLDLFVSEGEVVIQAIPEVRTHISYPFGVVYQNRSLENIFEMYGDQMGMKLRFKLRNRELLNRRVAFVGLQLQEFIDEIGLLALPAGDKLIIMEEEGHER